MPPKQLFLATGSNCENKEITEYLQEENININSTETDTIPSTSLIIMAATLLGSLLILSLEIILKKLRRNKDDYDVTEESGEPIRGQYSGHVICLDQSEASKDDYDVTEESGDSDTAGSDQKLLPWSESQKDEPIRGQYSGHVISLDQ